MTAALRQRVRDALDTQARYRRQAFIDAGEQVVCAGCGCDDDTYSIWCDTCSDRKGRRARRQDAGYRAAEQAKRRECRRVRRQMLGKRERKRVSA